MLSRRSVVLVLVFLLGLSMAACSPTDDSMTAPSPDGSITIGVELIGHHETGGDVPSYERQMEEAFALYDRLGVPAVKTGYAGPIRPEGIHHHSQQMVNHYRRVNST